MSQWSLEGDSTLEGDITIDLPCTEGAASAFDLGRARLFGAYGKAFAHGTVSRVQCSLTVEAGCLRVESRGQNPTGIRPAGGAWRLLTQQQRSALNDGDELALDKMRKPGTVFTVRKRPRGEPEVCSSAPVPATPTVAAVAAPPLTPHHATICSWNAATVAPKSGSSPDKLLMMLRELSFQPDILCLQETKFCDEKAEKRAKEATPQYDWHIPAGSYCRSPGRGVALLVKKGSKLAGGQLLELPWDNEHRVAAYETKFGLVVGTYMPTVSGRQGRLEKRLDYEEDLTSLLSDHKDRLLAVVGDMNVAPSDELDCSTPFWGKFFLAGEDGNGAWEERAVQLRDAHCKLLKDGGLVDAWRYHNPRRKEFTSFQDQGRHRSRNGWCARVDLVLVPEPQVAHVRPIIYSEITAHAAGRQSDHVPVGLQIALPLG